MTVLATPRQANTGHKFSLTLGWHKPTGQFCKYVGNLMGSDGKLKPRRWYLGQDATAAVIKLAQITKDWETLRANGMNYWNQDEAVLSALLGQVEGQGQSKDVAGPAPAVSPASPSGPSIAQTPPASAVLFKVAAKTYIENLRQRSEAGQVTHKHFESEKTRLQTAAAPLLSLRLSEVGQRQIEQAVFRLCKRPCYHKKCKHGSPSDRISVTHATACIRTLKTCLNFLADSDDFNWTKPRRFDRIFKSRPVATEDELAHLSTAINSEPDHFTIAELKALAKRASSFQYCLLLLGLNCGFCTAELASLLRSEIKGLDTRQPYIERLRRKTLRFGAAGSYAKWYLWKETAAALKKNLAPSNKADLALQNRQRNRLTKSNSLGQAWPRLLKSAGVRPLPWRFVRKTAAWLCRTLSGDDAVTEMFLSHSDRGVIRFYAGRDWDGKLKRTLVKMHKALTPIFKVRR